MNLLGAVRSRFPRVTLTLVGRSGEDVAIDFIVDTAFDGELSLPSSLLAGIACFSPSVRQIMLANGDIQDGGYIKVLLQDDGEQRVTEALISEIGSNALLGIDLLTDHMLTVEMTRDGEVVVEPL